MASGAGHGTEISTPSKQSTKDNRVELFNNPKHSVASILGNGICRGKTSLDLVIQEREDDSTIL
jgi:hypothetical protein